jgi:pyruvyltransferase
MSGGRPEHFVNELKKCEYIISSTLHGVMFSLAYGRKTIFTEFSNQVIGKGFKFFDFFESLGVNYNVLSFDNDRLLDNEIKIDKENLNKVGAEIVNVCPFVEPQRKAILIENWDKHVDLI